MRVGIEEERARSAKNVRAAEAQRDAIQKALEREQVARRVMRTAAEERQAALEAKLAEAEKCV